MPTTAGTKVPRHFVSPDGCDDGSTAERRRCRSHRQDQHARVRLGQRHAADQGTHGTSIASPAGRAAARARRWPRRSAARPWVPTRAGRFEFPRASAGRSGLKPTYGSISKNGIITHSWSLDHPGPLTRTVTDAALLMNVLAGHDPDDPSSRSVDVPDFRRTLGDSIGNLRIGVCRNHFFGENDSEVEAAVERAIEEIGGLAAEVVEFETPQSDSMVSVRSSPSSWLPHPPTTTVPSSPDCNRGSSRDVRNLVEAGKFITATDYLKAEQFRRILMRDFARGVRIGRRRRRTDDAHHRVGARTDERQNW